MGTLASYPQRVSKEKWSAPPPIAARMRKIKARHDQIQAIEAEVREEVTALVELGVPVAALAELFNVQRKTIYRWTGRDMT